MRIIGASCAILVLLGAAASLHAQSGCIAERVAGSEWQTFNAGTPIEVIVMTGGADVRCDGDRRILADQATVIRAEQRIELYGDVQVQDPERTLTADQATFHSAQQLLQAVGNVVVRDRRTGSTISSQLLDYYQETEDRPIARMEASSPTGAAHAVLFRAPATAGEPQPAGQPADSTLIDATHITVIGEQTFHAVGRAVMTRDSVRTTGNSIEYTQAAEGIPGSLAVAVNAVVEMPAQQLRGDSINALIGEGDELREVLTRHRAVLSAEDMEVTAPAIRLFFEDGGVTRMVAMEWPPAAGADPDPQARAETDSYRFEADSIDVLAPGQQITAAVAIGNAYGERLTPDSLLALLPELPPREMALISSDWMRGDTVRAAFAANPAAAVDPEAQERIMERLSAVGAPAQSVYRMRDEDAPEAKLSISYVSAAHIDVTFSDGVVSLVSAAGDAKGTYLQPTQVAGAATDGDGDRPPEQQ